MHNNFTFTLHKSYWIHKNQYTESKVRVRKMRKNKRFVYVEVEVLEPAQAYKEGEWFELWVVWGKLGL